MADPEGNGRVKRSFSRRLNLILAWTLGVVLGVPVLLYVTLRIGCAARVYSTYPVPGTDWVMEEHGPSCYFGGTYPDDLTARNLMDGTFLTIATNNVGAIDEVQFAPGQVTLRLPNRSWVDPVVNKFGGIKVIYDYQPHDDPADRAAYRRWVKNTQDVENRRWFCNSVYPTLPPESQKLENRSLSPDHANAFDKAGNINDSIAPYCPAPQ